MTLSSQIDPPYQSRTLAIGIAVIGVLCLLALIWPLARLFIPFPIDINEPWNALLADRAMGAAALYPPATGGFFNNYPPLSFYIVGLAGRLVGDNLIAGRLISVLAILVIALNIGWTVRNLGGSSKPAILAGVLFAATMAKSFTGYTGMDDPQLLAQAVMSSGLAVFSAAPRRTRNVAAAAVIMVVAGFIKHNIFAMPLAATLWLAQYDRPMLARWLALCLVLLAAGVALCGAIYGADFFHQLMQPRTYDPMVVLKSLGRAQAFAIPLILWIAFAVQVPPDPRVRMVTDLIVAGAAAYAITQAGTGVAWNAFFDWLIATCIGLGVALTRISETRFARRYGIALVEGLIIAALALRLILLPPPELLNLRTYLADLRADADGLAPDIEFMRGHPGPALCESLAICYWSGHQSILDKFGSAQAARHGAPIFDELKAGVSRGEVPLLQLSHGSAFIAPAEASGLYQRFETPNAVYFYR